MATDAGCGPIIDKLGDDLDELIGLLAGWSAQIQASGGYPGAGPMDLAALASR